MRAFLIRLLGGYSSFSEAAASVDKNQAIIDLGGFVDVDDFIDHVRELPLTERHKILSLAVKRMFNTITVDDILSITKTAKGVDIWSWQGKPLPEAQIALLKAEAKQFSESFFWKVLATELRYQGNKRIYTQSEDIPDLVAGKLLSYYIDIVESRCASMLK
jgi:hypothetical protein